MKEYIIRKGKHSSGIHFSPHSGIDRLEFDFRFGNSCLYDSREPFDHINKLYGFSYLRHHRNSIRVGWRPSRDNVMEIDLFFYLYNNGQRIIQQFATVEVLQDYNIIIEVPHLYQLVSFRLREADSSLTLASSSLRFDAPACKWGYRLFPYFGGSAVSPQDMRIWVQEK